MDGYNRTINMDNNKRKVLLISPNPKSAVGGIARWTGHVLRYYAQKGREQLDLVYHSYSKAVGGFASDSKLTRIKKAFHNYLPLYKEFVALIKKEHFDVVHLCSSASWGLLRDIAMIRAAKRKSIKTVIHFRFGRIPELYQNKNWEQKLLDKIIRLVDMAVVIDKQSYTTLMEFGYSNIRLLPNPLTPEVNEICAANQNIQREERKIVFAGHVVPTKGVFELVEACKQIKGIKVKMLGYVSDEMLAAVQQHAGDNCTQWLDITGNQDYEITIKEMLSAGVFVLPTHTEGFPNVILESMACGCPIVTTDVGAIPEMLDIEHGFNHGICVKPRQVEELRAAIIKMLDDREYAMQCGQNAQRRVNEMYSMPKVWEGLVEIWGNA